MTDKTETMTVAPTPAFGVVSTSEQQRAIAEVQAAMIIARGNPRDPIRAMDLIRQDCTRPSLAERALYTYARGGTEVTGPSIRLAECLAQRWGNIQYGTRELEQHGDDSLMQAYAWDLETNVRREMIVTVPHVRDTKKGRIALTDARDVYEITANMGARRLRACILGLIPGGVVEEAIEQVELTLKTKADVTPERVAKMLETFAAFGVTKDQIEKRIQRRAAVDTLTPALLLQLGKIANSIRDGMSVPNDWFSDTAGQAVSEGGQRVSTVADVLSAGVACGWTQKQILKFVREKFGKEMTALEPGVECATAVLAVVAWDAPAVAEPSAPDAVEMAENAAIDREAAEKDGLFPAPVDRKRK